MTFCVCVGCRSSVVRLTMGFGHVRVLNAIVSIPSNCRLLANRRLPVIARDDDNNYYYYSSATINAIINRTDRHVTARPLYQDALRIVYDGGVELSSQNYTRYYPLITV